VNVLFALCAAGITVDRYSNRLSIFNLIEQIVSPGFPAWLPEVTFLVVLRRENNEAGQFQARAEIRVGDNAIGAPTQVAVDFEGGNTARQIMNFQGIPVPAPGELTFRLFLPDNQVATVTIPVTRAGANVVAPAQPVVAPQDNQ
jgi:hypothetical protein